MVKSKDLHFYSMAFWVYIELLAFYNRKQWKRQLILRNVSDSETLSRGLQKFFLFGVCEDLIEMIPSLIVFL